MTDNILELTDVHADIDQYHILHGVDLVVPRGELTVLLADALAALRARHAALLAEALAMRPAP